MSGKMRWAQGAAGYLALSLAIACGEITAPTARQIAKPPGDDGPPAQQPGPMTPFGPPAMSSSPSASEPKPSESDLDNSLPAESEVPPNNDDGDEVVPDDAVTNLAYRPGLGRVVDIVAGFDHTCALLDTGQVRCWGDGLVLGYGEEGNVTPGEAVGDDERPASVGFVTLGEPARQISAGLGHTCALLDSGGVRCWGDSYTGELGYGNAETIGDDETVASAGNVDVGSEVRQVVGGSQATCALLQDGALRCWGLRYSGAPILADPPAPIGCEDQLECEGSDAGSEGSRSSPDAGAAEGVDEEIPVDNAFPPGPPTPIPSTLAPIALGARVEQVGIAAEHSCALLEGGRVRCWGEGDNGRLGYANTDDIDYPSEARDVDVGGPVKQIAVGPSQTCAVLEAGNVRCWGLAVDGRLGYGNTNDIGDDETPASAGDVDVGGPVRTIGMQGSLVCALLEAGTVRCWGPGYGMHPDGTEPDPDDGVGIDGGPEDGVIWSCRPRDYRVSDCPGFVGALGYGITGSIGDDETPALMGDLKLAGPVKKLAVGGRHACVLLETGGVQCWGSGTVGTLGYGKLEEIGDDETPEAAGFVDVAGPPTLATQPTRALQVAAGERHTCAVLDNEAVRCWGDASTGQLGYGNRQDIGDDEDPIVAGDVDVRGIVRQVATGTWHTCALLDSGAVRCWGAGSGGELGYDDTRDIGYANVPGSAGYLDLGGPARDVQIGAYESCAILKSGALRCWGMEAVSANTSASADDDAPIVVNVDVGGPVQQVALGQGDKCVLLDTGRVRCWGRGYEAVIGYVDGAVAELTTPAEVPEVELPGRAIQITVGYYTACALLEDGSVHCWSKDFMFPPWDPEGDGVEKVPGPVVISELDAPAVQLTSGGDENCALLTDRQLRCWDAYETPPTFGIQDIPLGAPLQSVALGATHSCAILEGGRARCWGITESGALGQPELLDLGYVDSSELQTDIHLF